MTNITKQNYRVALLDDDPIFCRTTKKALHSVGIGCTYLHNLDQLLGSLSDDPPDLILLDLDLGNACGHNACRTLRTMSNLPIIMLTGTECPNMIVSCLEVGADDYVLKPFNADELGARIRAVLRRRVAQKAQPSTQRVSGSLHFDVLTATITGEQGECHLSTTESALLSALMDIMPGSVNRAQLSRLALKRGWTSGDRTIDVLVGRLRKKIGSVTRSLDIVTQRGAGYALRDVAVSQPI